MDLPAGWHWATLGELAADEPRSITDGTFGSNLTSAHYTDSGARVIRLQNIGNGVFRDAAAYISLDHFETLRKHEVRAGDLLVASLGENLPRACLMPEIGEPAIVKADCIRIRLRPDVDSHWVLLALQRREVKVWAEGIVKGVGRQRLGLKAIRSILIPIAPRIERDRVLRILEPQLSRIIRASRLADSAGVRRVSFRRSASDQAVSGTDLAMVPLGEFVDRVEAGRSFGGSAAPAGPGEWGVIRVSAMTWGEFRPEENKRVPVELANPKYEIQAGDVLVSRANTTAYVGAPVFVHDTRPNLLLSDKSLRLVPKSGVDPRWLVAAMSMQRVRSQVSALATGTKDSMRNISQSNLLSVSVPFASVEQQAAALVSCDAAGFEAERLTASIENVERRGMALRRSLLDAAFSGRL